MADLNLTVAQDALKEYYLIGLRNLINKQTIAWDRIARYDKFNPEGCLL